LKSNAVIGLIVIALLGGGLRLVVMEETFPLRRMVGDEFYYSHVAFHMAAGNGAMASPKSRAVRPPGHPFLMSLVIPEDLRPNAKAFSRATHRFLILQVVLGTSIAVLTGLLGMALFDRRVGLLAGLVVAVYPNLIAFSHTLWGENLFTALFLAALLLVVHGQRSQSWPCAVAAGLVFGAGTLTREVSLVLAGVSALWWVANSELEERRSALRKTLVMLVISVGCVLPWTARNYRVFDRLVPVSTVGWFAAAEGNTFDQDDWLAYDNNDREEFKKQYMGIHDEMERMDFARAHALDRIASEQPTWIFKKAVRTAAHLFTPDSTMLYLVREGGYGALDPGRVKLLVGLSTLPYALVIIAATLGIAAAPDRRRFWLPCLILGVSIAIHVLYNANVRFRIPWMPLLSIYACSAWFLGRGLKQAIGRRGWIAVACVLAVFFGLCVPYFRQDYLALLAS
jgi:4-amino-4-deoxy-L-arabinose transferase-like glycosyltransferase